MARSRGLVVKAEDLHPKSRGIKSLLAAYTIWNVMKAYNYMVSKEIKVGK